jgi:predicted oxidoreductase (fatty acid repression mutant protein)
MSATPIKADSVLDLIKARRTYYALNKDLTITPARIQEIVKEALRQVPSSFNSQSNRVIVLFGAEHDKLWDLTSEALKPIVPADAWEGTAGKMAMFKAAAGTVSPMIASISPTARIPTPADPADLVNIGHVL